MARSVLKAVSGAKTVLIGLADATPYPDVATATKAKATVAHDSALLQQLGLKPGTTTLTVVPATAGMRIRGFPS